MRVEVFNPRPVPGRLVAGGGGPGSTASSLPGLQAAERWRFSLNHHRRVEEEEEPSKTRPVARHLVVGRRSNIGGSGLSSRTGSGSGK